MAESGETVLEMETISWDSSIHFHSFVHSFLKNRKYCVELHDLNIVLTMAIAFPAFLWTMSSGEDISTEMVVRAEGKKASTAVGCAREIEIGLKTSSC